MRKAASLPLALLAAAVNGCVTGEPTTIFVRLDPAPELRVLVRIGPNGEIAEILDSIFDQDGETPFRTAGPTSPELRVLGVTLKALFDEEPRFDLSREGTLSVVQQPACPEGTVDFANGTNTIPLPEETTTYAIEAGALVEAAPLSESARFGVSIRLPIDFDACAGAFKSDLTPLRGGDSIFSGGSARDVYRLSDDRVLIVSAPNVYLVSLDPADDAILDTMPRDALQLDDVFVAAEVVTKTSSSVQGVVITEKEKSAPMDAGKALRFTISGDRFTSVELIREFQTRPNDVVVDARQNVLIPSEDGVMWVLDAGADEFRPLDLARSLEKATTFPDAETPHFVTTSVGSVIAGDFAREPPSWRELGVEELAQLVRLHAIAVVPTQAGFEIWTAPDGRVFTYEEGGRFERLLPRLHPSLLACALDTTETCEEPVLAGEPDEFLHVQDSNGDDFVILAYGDCPGLSVVRTKDRCASALIPGGERPNLEAVHRTEDRVTIAGKRGALFELILR